jgi:hypothetical protein
MSSAKNRPLEIFGRDFLQMTESRQQYWLGRARSFWRSQGFPYPTLSEAEMRRDFSQLERVTTPSVLQEKLLVHSTVGLRLANSFHPQIWHVPVHGRSAVDVFSDDDRLVRVLQKAARFWPNRRCWNAQCIRSVLRIMHRIRVSNFRPTVARVLLDRYSGHGDHVLDFSAGYGGRLLGALTLERKYTGIDPAIAQVSGLNLMAQAFSSQGRGTASIIQGCAEDVLPTLGQGTFSTVLSSPPYFNLERYSEEPTQSYRRYPLYEEWKKGFLKIVLCESHRILEKGGCLLLNVADSGRFAIASESEEICRRAFGTPRRVLKMLIASGPGVRSQAFASAYRWEPIYVFRKA